jgi:small subunit ribosomal protein S24e
MLDVYHPGKAGVSKADLRKLIAQTYKVQDENTIFLYGFKYAFGGGKSSGFGLIYDNILAAKSYEPKYRLRRVCIP